MPPFHYTQFLTDKPKIHRTIAAQRKKQNLEKKNGNLRKRSQNWKELLRC